MRPALAACLLAACTTSSRPAPEGGTVTVHEASQLALRDTQRPFIVFQDPDGSYRRADFDAAGNASGELVAGGSVIVAKPIQGGDAPFEMYTDVQPGAAIELGVPDREDPPTARLLANVELPPNTRDIAYGSPCGSDVAAPDGAIDLDAACNTTELVMVACNYTPTVPLAATVTSALVGPKGCADGTVYVDRSPQAVAPGAQVTVRADEWMALSPVAIDLAHADDVSRLELGTAWGFSSPGQIDGSVVSALLPPVGPIFIDGGAQRDDRHGQSFYVRLPAGARTLDLADVLAPWDADGSEQAIVEQFTWIEHTLVVYPPADTVADPVHLEPPELPDFLRYGSPALGTKVEVFRVQGADPDIDPQRLATIAMNGGDPSWTSVAITRVP